MIQYQTFTLEFEGKEPEGFWSEIDLHAEFVCKGTVKKVSGFYAGDRHYKVRYLPQETGMVEWKITGLFNEQGKEECVACADGIHHGVVKPNGTAMKYEDGTICRTFGTTVYAMMHQSEDVIQETIDTILQSPFNKIRTCMFPKHYVFNENEPEYFAFERKKDGSFDFHRPCMKFWDAFERMIRIFDERQIQVDLILFHPYDWWGFAKMTKEQYLLYLNYLLARFAAFPNLWWSLANEYDCMTAFSKEDWTGIEEYISNTDVYGHMLSCHYMLESYDYSRKNVTHCSVQGDVTEVENLMKQYGKPVLMDEFGYEGNIFCHWGNLSAFEEVHRFWLCCVMGGYGTHGETYMNDTDTLWWGKGGKLVGQSPARIGFLREIIEELPGALEPVGSSFVTAELLEKVRNGEVEIPQDDFIRAVLKLPVERAVEVLRNLNKDTRIYTGHCGEEAYLAYYGRHCTAEGEIELPENHTYDLEVLDVWKMTRKTILTGVKGKVQFTLPGKEGIAVLAKRVDNCKNEISNDVRSF